MAYGRDLGKLLAFAEASEVSEIEAIDLGRRVGLDSARCPAPAWGREARRVTCPSARGLCKFLMREGVLRADPTELAARPRFGRKLPRALGENEMVTLIEAPPPDTLRGLRDRAMLSLMYAAGLRVSELVSLRWATSTARAASSRPWARVKRDGWCRWAKSRSIT